MPKRRQQRRWRPEPPEPPGQPGRPPPAYEARDVPGRFYLYEVYASAAAFAEHLQTQPVHDFIAAVPALSTAQPGSLVQLDEITVG